MAASLCHTLNIAQECMCKAFALLGSTVPGSRPWLQSDSQSRLLAETRMVLGAELLSQRRKERGASSLEHSVPTR